VEDREIDVGFQTAVRPPPGRKEPVPPATGFPGSIGEATAFQTPSLPMRMERTVYFSGSRFLYTEAAEASETSCSAERPPNISPIRAFGFMSYPRSIGHFI
jgi:hypothetical protein